ncbi:hypothetical protein CAPSP0001_2158 [Capnocytophaga sputigena ATCC 33612]|nr:hypothetical protein CAPSP0001_2158 [Capnocytophaga sputigena ATCC 33612]
MILYPKETEIIDYLKVVLNTSYLIKAKSNEGKETNSDI